ncbi:MAG: DUF362 domain-containing protein [Candidatus Bathyarchaeota archaeon]|nr:DUF362 domain-containing protein [Candidatus Bathyarchaeota archaeon]
MKNTSVAKIVERLKSEFFTSLYQVSAVSTFSGIGEAAANPFQQDGLALISKITASSNIKASVLKAVELLGGLEKAIHKGDEVLLKPNFNTGDPPPASSDPNFVEAIIKLLYEHGASKVILGESSMFSLCTRKVLEDTGMLNKAESAGAEVVPFDEGKWIRISTGGRYLKKASLPEKALGRRKLVYACCMKTHKWARFSLSLKLAVGFMKPGERMLLHARNLQEKIADLNLVVHPSLIVMDGRTCFIDGGPACGELREPNLVLASGDRVAIDAEAIETIKSYEGSNLQDDPWTYTQIQRASELGIGAKNKKEYTVVS